jgi:DNA polymerase-1
VKLLLVDGFYYAYRSFYAIPPLTNPQGQPTGAIYGFLKSLRRMLKDLRPDRAAVVWDEGLPERRTQLQPAYKANREEMPEALSAQIEPMRELIGFLGFQNVSLPGTEADDLMASYALAAERLGWETTLATADKDLFQIVRSSIQVYASQNGSQKTSGSQGAAFGLLGESYVAQKWGVTPTQLGDVLSLVGDSADNIPGVPGVGPKGAAGLISQFGSVDGLYADLKAVKSEKLREKLFLSREQVFQNREMVRLDTHLELPVALEQLRVEPKYEALLEALDRCALKSLRAEIALEAPRLPALRQEELF